MRTYTRVTYIPLADLRQVHTRWRYAALHTRQMLEKSEKGHNYAVGDGTAKADRTFAKAISGGRSAVSWRLHWWLATQDTITNQFSFFPSTLCDHFSKAQLCSTASDEECEKFCACKIFHDDV